MHVEGSSTFQVTERPLPTNPGYYEAACVDEFTVYLPKSQVKKLSIRHDNTGHGADWFLDFVSLQCKDCASGQDGITYFPCFAWLKDDGHVACLKRELSPCATDPRQELVAYTVDVHTSRLPDSGTEANAYVELVSLKGKTGKVQIEAAGGLKAGSCNQVMFDHYALGPIVSCTLFLDSSHGNASWRVDKVDVMAQPFQRGPADILTFWFCTQLTAWAGEDMASVSAERSSSLSDAPRKYTVTVKTSSMKGAGTDDDIFLSLSGSGASAADLPLAASASAFEPGSCDTFTLVLPFLGKLQQAVLAMGPEGTRAGWHVAWLHVVVEELAATDDRAATGRPDEFRFVHKGWVSHRDAGGRRTTGPMAPVPSYEPFEEVAVTIETVTCVDKGAGTDADVYVRAHTASALGEASVSGWARLPALVESLERGMLDSFDVMLSSITGRLQRLDVRVEPCALAAAPSWSFEHIKVSFNQLSNGQALKEEAFFNGPCTLHAAAPEASLPASRESVWCGYRVTVWTASSKHAGTDGDILLQLEGSLGTSPVLKVPGCVGDFVAGSQTVKAIRQPRIGSIQGMAMATNVAAGQGWDVLKVLVEEEGTANSAWFACPGRVPGGKLKALNKYMDDPELSMLTVKVSATTATTWQADTDSTVWIILVGTQRSSDQLELQPEGHTAFHKGATDHFSFQIHDIGELQALEVGHSNDGASPCWCPEQITVTLEKGQHSGSTVVFYHNQMIPAARGGMCSARLVPSTAAAGEKQRYRICTSTGDTPGNCLDHPAQVVLFGDGAVPPEDLESVMSPGGAPGPGRAGPFVLEVTDTGEQPFQRRAQNTFTVTGAPLRSVTHVVVGHACDSQSWHLAWLEVQLDGVVSSTRRFYCYEWLSLSRGQGRLQVCLSTTVDPMAAYDCLIRTGDCRCAGTSADVKIELHGPAGRSGTVALQDTAIVTPFRRGRCDDFRFRCLSVAPIQALSVICETPEDHEKAWFLDWVAVRPGPQAPWVYFSFNCWIPSNRALTRVAQSSHPETACADYRVVVKTAGAPGFADSAVTMNLHSPSGEQQEVCLSPRSGIVPAAPCEHGFEDVLLVKGVPISSVARVVLSADTTADRGPWFLQWLRIINCTSGDTLVFAATSLFGPAAAACDSAQTHELKLCTETEKDALGFFRVEVCSAAGAGAPLAERVYLTLLSAAGAAVPEILLEPAPVAGDQRFQPGSAHASVHRLALAAAVTSVKLRFGVAGGSPRWRPASVTLTNMATSEGTTFTSAEGAGTSTAGEAGEFVEVVLERALPGHTATEGATEGHTATVGSAAGPLHARPVPEEHAASSLLSDYALTLHVQPGLRSGRMQLLVNLRGDGEPHETGPRVCRAMAAGRGRAVAALDGAPDVGELRACELAVVESGGSATHEPSAVLEMVTVENFSTGAVYHCASRRALSSFVAGDGDALQTLQLHPGGVSAAGPGAGARQDAVTCSEDLARLQAPRSGSHGAAMPAAASTSHGAAASGAQGKAAPQRSHGGGYTIIFRIKGVALPGHHAHVSFQLVGTIQNSEVEAVSADHFASASTTFLEYATMPFCGDVQALRLRISSRGCLQSPRLALHGVDVTCVASGTTYSFGAAMVEQKNSYAVTLQRPLVRTGSGLATVRPETYAATRFRRPQAA